MCLCHCHCHCPPPRVHGSGRCREVGHTANTERGRRFTVGLPHAFHLGSLLFQPLPLLLALQTTQKPQQAGRMDHVSTPTKRVDNTNPTSGTACMYIYLPTLPCRVALRQSFIFFLLFLRLFDLVLLRTPLLFFRRLPCDVGNELLAFALCFLFVRSGQLYLKNQLYIKRVKF